MIIDVHAHMAPASLLEAIEARAGDFPSVALEQVKDSLVFQFPGAERTRPVAIGLRDETARLDWMDSQGIERQMVGGWLDMFGYQLPAAEGAAWSRLINAEMLAFCQANPRFIALPTVPLQDGASAAAMLAEVMDAGCPGVMIGTQPKGAGGVLDDPALDPFWHMASKRQALVFIHPVYDSGDARVDDYGLRNAIGRITDTTIAVSRLMCAGHPTRFAGARMLIATGGAALAFALGRLKRNHDLHPDDVADPLAQFRALYFDTLLHDPKALRFLADIVGAERIMMGSDKPFPIGDPEPAKIIEAAGFTARECRAMTGGTAENLFGL